MKVLKGKKFISSIILSVMLANIILPLSSFATDETVDLEIATKEELVAFANDVNNGNTYEGKTIALTANINLNGSESDQWTPIGYNLENQFKGTFEGNEYAISGLYINNTNYEDQGLFGNNYGTIKDVKIKNINIKDSSKNTGAIAGVNAGTIYNCSVESGNIAVNTGYEYSGTEGLTSYDIIIGGIVGSNYSSGTIEKCSNKVNIVCNKLTQWTNGTLVTRVYTGGIVGQSYSKTTLKNCYNSGSIESDGIVGGIVAKINWSGTLEENYSQVIGCYNTGNITAKGTENHSYHFGGIIGEAEEVKILQCYNAGTITDSYNAKYIGGIAGQIIIKSVIQSSYNKATLSGGAMVAGICAMNEGSTIIDCFNIGNISGKANIGGIACFNNVTYLNGTPIVSKISRCYNTGNITGETSVAGISCNNGGYNDQISGTQITECYNTGIITANSSAGGIVASNDAIIKNTYNVGNIVCNQEQQEKIGSIVGYDDGENANNIETVINNVYYKEGTAQLGIGYNKGTNEVISKSESEMKNTNFVTLLNNDGQYFSQDVNNRNGGYPILKDEVSPTLTVSYSTTQITDQDVTVTITSNEQIQAVSGWTLSKDKLKLTKTYSENVAESITVKDLAGNTATAQINITNIYKNVTITFAEANMYNAVVENLIGKIVEKDDNAYSITISRTNLEGITNLDLSGKEITNIAGIENFTNLQILNMSNNEIKDISKLKTLTNLTSLNLNINQLEDNDLSNLNNLKNLSVLAIGKNKNITSVKNISGLINLKTLNIAINNVEELTGIEELTKLSNLTAYENKIKNISKLSSLTELINIDFSYNNIASIDEIKNLTNLQQVNFMENNIAQIPDLSSLTKLSIILLEGQKIYLHAAGNLDEDISLGLPDIFLKALDSNSDYYIGEGEEILLNNCSLGEDNASVIVNPYVAAILESQLMIQSGKLNGSILKIYGTTVDYGYEEEMEIDGLKERYKLDFNEDGVVDEDDVQCILDYVVGKLDNVIILENISVADFNGDGRINDRDAAILLKALEGNTVKIFNIISVEDKINKDVIAKILSSNPNVVTNENSQNTFTENGEKDLYYVDENNDTQTLKATVNFIDKIAPTYEIKYSETEMTNQDVTVTIRVSEPVIDIYEYENEEGENIRDWNISEDRMTLTKVYTENVEDLVPIVDEALNSVYIEINITNILKQIPEAGTLIMKLESEQGEDYTNNLWTNKNVYIALNKSTIENTTTTYSINGGEEITSSQILSENGEYEIIVKTIDVAGNENTNVYNIKIDKDAPQVGTLIRKVNSNAGEDFEGERTNENIYIDVEDGTDTLSGHKSTTYRVNNGEETTEPQILRATGEYNITVTTTDKAGNYSTREYQFEIAKEGPTITVENETLSNNTVKVTLKSNKKLQTLNGWTLSEDKLSLYKIYSLNTQETVIVKDTLGNETQVNIVVNSIDDKDFIAVMETSTTTLTNKDVIVYIKANKEMKPLDGWILSSDKKVLTKTYSQNIQEIVIVSDLIGNTKNIQIVIDNIDKQAPNGQISYSSTTLTNQNVIVTIQTDEQVRDIDGWNLSDDLRTLSKEYTQNTQENITLTDLAGNEKTLQITIDNIDKQAPTTTVSYSTTNLTNGNVQVTITANEEVQAINGWSLSTNKKELTKQYTNNANENVTIIDLAGNITTAQVTINNIDKQAPTTTVSYSTTNLTNGNVQVTITANEEVQEINGWSLSANKRELTKQYTDNANENITIIDLAGNRTITQVTINNIDKQVPILTVSYSTTQATQNPVTVTITANEEVQEINGWNLQSNKKVLTKVYSKNTQEAGETVTIKDLAGNTSQITVKVLNIINEVQIETKYTLTEDGYVMGILPGTTLEEFKNNFNVNVEIENTSIVKTGMTAKINNKAYTLVVIGDIKEDGQINLIDLVKIKRHIVKFSDSILTRANLKAADINLDGEVNTIDLAQMKQILIGRRQLK